MSKEMLGGCCVCSDERGWTENPLVYCDGQGCTVAVHQACYGIVSVPTGPWFCRKCESQERAVRVKCELCPSKDGALKRTDNNGWAHVVCALYIPEVRFGNVTTMEPIILQLIPQERFNRTCYICQEAGKGTKTTSGACMQCNKAGCKQQFHVTCAQALGLLCEEAGNFMDNVKYCGYCQHHNSKLKKGGNVKPIPPYKPIATGEHDSSPEKEGEMSRSSSGKKKSYLAVKAPNVVGLGKPKTNSPGGSPDLASVYTMDTNEDEDDGTGSGAGVTLKIGTTSSHASETGTGGDTRNKFTTSNFIETVVTQSEPVFGSDTKTQTSPDGAKGKKRKSSSAGVKTDDTVSTSSSLSGSTSTPVSTITTSPIKNPSVTLSHLKTTVAASASKSSVSISGLGKNLTVPQPTAPKSNLAVYGTGTKITIAASREDPKKPKTEVTSVLTSAPPTTGVVIDKTPNQPIADAAGSDTQAGKRPRSSSQDKGRKPKRPQTRRPGSGTVKDEADSPPGSPDMGRSRKKTVVKEEKDVKPGISTVSAPHMLGNQLNPASSMAQKMHDSLHQEVEAHSIYSQDSQQTNLVGPPLPRKFRATTSDKTATLSAANSLLSLGNPAAPANPSSTPNQPNQPQGLEQLLERQWEQGSQFLMEQAQHFDIASLLSCLHQLKSENLKLEEHVNSLQQRRDHLLAVNARLTVPLGGNTTQQQPTPAPAPTPEMNNETRTNGGDTHTYVQQMQHVAPSPPISVSRGPVYANAHNTHNPQARRPVVSQYPSYSNQPQMNANAAPPMGVRRDDQHQQI